MVVKDQEPKKDYLINDTEKELKHAPLLEDPNYIPAHKLEGKVAIITGGDSGIGAATAILFAKEGADIVIVYYESDKDANNIAKRIREIGRQVLVLSGDIADEGFIKKITAETSQKFGHVDILVNNAGEQHVHEHFLDIPMSEVTRIFKTNVIGMFMLTKAIFPLFREGGSIINTTSITAYAGSPVLVDYSASKGAILSFTRSLAQNEDILEKKIRVNAVAPGPIWTPLIPATFTSEQLKTWGKSNALKRPGQAFEVAPSYLFLAAEENKYITGQTIHVNGGSVVNG
ncbi:MULTISPECIES: SDR family oxidoreductase [Lactobacillaceae]|uniref:Oxidoreductase n=2 Tax=Liquorilactobacillus TaxID=2767888 RepID=A0A0R1MMH6_9LACO|nr:MULTISPECIES: SDR family oxidoreductase [Lactobacillaceae]KEP87539.1 short-chain dehydrogenase [Oenococcus oeni IOEB_0501]KRL06613.1 oxidoreductase [Liquorilactobacillus oeni DSM 19972]KRN08207.1 oxidoreductase [Liquorilactobacillus mali KCTC 3596 = DSM 20444]SYW05687.1 putative oxidoreductase [Oenococcus oeni]